MSLTSAQLRNRVADHLRISAVDRELSAERAAKIDDAIDDCFAELRERSLLWWSDDAIPQAAVFALTLIVSAQACAKVGKAGQGYETGDTEGYARLAKLKTTAISETVQPDYF
jgi:hypothetical protein